MELENNMENKIKIDGIWATTDGTWHTSVKGDIKLEVGDTLASVFNTTEVMFRVKEVNENDYTITLLGDTEVAFVGPDTDRAMSISFGTELLWDKL